MEDESRGPAVADQFRKKPVVIHARQWDGTTTGATQLVQWVRGENGDAQLINRHRMHALRTNDSTDTGAFIVINTLEGPHRCNPTDWVIRGVANEHYPCRADIFEQTYEPAGD